MMFIIMLVILVLPFVFACRGGGYYDWPAGQSSTSTLKNEYDDGSMERQVASGWGGFDVPSDLAAEWKDWYTKYKLEQEQENNDPDAIAQLPRGPGSGWPDSWMNINAGHAGFPPNQVPPWAQVPKNTGLPSYCYLPLQRGNCTQKLTRWAYNPYEDLCVEFTYTGCFGNDNNFRSKDKCMQKCIQQKPPSPCDWNTDISRERTLYDPYRRTEYRDGSHNNTRKCGY